MIKVKTISLWQPWASLIAAGAKRYETRDWKPNPAILKPGDTLAIHAAKRWTREERELIAREPFRSRLALAALRRLWNDQTPPLGCIVAVGTLARVVEIDRAPEGFRRMLASDHDERAFGNFGPGRYAWQITDVRALARPIPCSGAQGVWDWLPERPLGELVYADELEVAG